MDWTPPRRPQWLERLIACGEAVGGPEHLVSLDARELLETASAGTGLADFGGDEWRPHYEVLLESLCGESGLHLAGRMLTRAELLQTLRNRLELTALWAARPELPEGPVREPVFIVGSPRSGTSILHELMACDPATRAPAMWEMQHPVAAVRGEDRSQVSDRVVQLWHDLQPEYETMHANSGHLPNECIFITMHAFLSDHWSGVHVAPRYEAHLVRADHRTAYRYHRRFLATLQARSPVRRWLLKAPSHLSQLPALFDVYPDARIVRTHRDPLRVLPSALDLMGTLKWMRCSRVDLRFASRAIPRAFASLYEREIQGRASGALPDERFVDVHFGELVRDPVACVARIYESLGWPLGDEVRDAVARYAERNPRGGRGVHHYSLAGVGLDAEEERARFAPYMEHYGVEREEP